jgi:D-glycero-D-manno-heptose 1,7-bisphosphate phosphatase
MKRAVFLDRDGTIIVEKEYLCDPAQVELLPGAGRALRRLQDSGLLLFIVTNQSGIGRGYFTVKDMERVHARMLEKLEHDGVGFEKIYFAPEAPDQPSRGRKPSPQFLFDAQAEFAVALSGSYIVGDKAIDLECGWKAGVRRALLVRTGYGAKHEKSLGSNAARTVVTDDLAGAAEWILNDLGQS